MSFKCDKCEKSVAKSSSLNRNRKTCTEDKIVQFMLEYLEKQVDNVISDWGAEAIVVAKPKFPSTLTDTIDFANTEVLCGVRLVRKK